MGKFTHFWYGKFWVKWVHSELVDKLSDQKEGHMDPIDELESGRVKRFFRARQKINVPGVISHITQRASGAEKLFHEEDDYLEMLARLKQTSQTHGIEFIAFVLMPNHLHLLLEQSEANLHEAMRELFSRYARRHNKKYERKGHLFGGRYRQAVCLDESYFIAVSLYIHLNPVRAGLVLQPREYRWSSCRLYTDSEVGDSFVSPHRILELLFQDTPKAKDIYREMLEEGRKIKMGEVLEDRRAVYDFQRNMSNMFYLLRKLAGLRKDAPPKHWADSELDERIASLEEGRLHPLPSDMMAKKYVVEQMISRGFTRKEIAQKLGISRKTVYNLLSQPPR
jgi:putative transposase